MWIPHVSWWQLAHDVGAWVLSLLPLPTPLPLLALWARCRQSQRIERRSRVLARVGASVRRHEGQHLVRPVLGQVTVQRVGLVLEEVHGLAGRNVPLDVPLERVSLNE